MGSLTNISFPTTLKNRTHIVFKAINRFWHIKIKKAQDKYFCLDFRRAFWLTFFRRMRGYYKMSIKTGKMAIKDPFSRQTLPKKERRIEAIELFYSNV